MTEQLNTFKDIITCIIGSAYLLWAYTKSLKENTVNGMTNVPNFVFSFVKYIGVVPLIVILVLLTFWLSVLGIVSLASTFIH
jgi:hypothetical protein